MWWSILTVISQIYKSWRMKCGIIGVCHCLQVVNWRSITKVIELWRVGCGPDHESFVRWLRTCMEDVVGPTSITWRYIALPRELVEKSRILLNFCNKLINLRKYSHFITANMPFFRMFKKLSCLKIILWLVIDNIL